MKKTIAQRLKALEARLAAIEKPSRSKTKPWLKHAGWARNDALYDEAMRLGAEWRRAS